MVFTVSHKWYADVILNHIDPENKYFQHRLYRDHCIKTTDNVYVKDLRVLRNRDLKETILVDNAVYSFGAQLSNGIPITPFKDDLEDQEFLSLINFIKYLGTQDDMRAACRESFKLEQVHKFNLDNFIEMYDYDLAEEEDTSSDEEDTPESENDAKKLSRSVTGFLDKFSNEFSVLAKNKDI